MSSPSFEDLIQDATSRPHPQNPADQMLIMLLAGRADKKFLEPFKKGLPRDFQKLFQQAAQGDLTSKERATLAIVAFRQGLEAEALGDKNDSIKQGRLLFQYITQDDYPYLWATTHLRIGTVLAGMSKGDPSKIREAIRSLEDCLTVARDDDDDDVALCVSACYNLALAYDSIWQMSDEWDEGDDESRSRAIEYGIRTLRLSKRELPQGGGDLVYLAQLLLTRTHSARLSEERDVAALTIDVLEPLLTRKNAQDLGPDEKKNIYVALAGAYGSMVVGTRPSKYRSRSEYYSKLAHPPRRIRPRE